MVGCPRRTGGARKGTAGELVTTAASNPFHSPTGQRSVWAILGDRWGDKSQILGLAEALGWPYDVKQLAFNRWRDVPNPLLGATLASIDRRRSSALAPPWPSLALSASKRSVPAAWWVRSQSGGRTRLVHIGRPWAPLDSLDLIVTTAQYRLPVRPNILHNATSLHGVTAARLKSAAERWEGRFRHLPRPLVVLMVGGHSPPYWIGRSAAMRLAAAANEFATRAGGSVLATSSSRTPRHVMPILESVLGCPAHLHHWRANDPDNPYLGYLALGDAMIVTSDSASMLSEACGTGKPVYVFRLPRILPLRARPPGGALQAVAGGILAAGLYTPSRDMNLFERRLIEAGLARPLLENGTVARLDDARGRPSRSCDDLARTVERVRALFGGP